MRGGLQPPESHFWLINTCHTVAIVRDTEIGLQRWLQFQTTVYAEQATDNGLTGSDRPRQLPNITTQQQEKVPPMFKKTLISLAVASSVGLTGCFDSGETGANANPDYQIEDTTIDKSVVRPVFDPNPLSPTLAVPAHFDLLLLLGATQSANHDFTALPTGAEPVRSALNELNGFSTSSAFNIAFDGELNPETVLAGQTDQQRHSNHTSGAPGRKAQILGIGRQRCNRSQRKAY